MFFTGGGRKADQRCKAIAVCEWLNCKDVIYMNHYILDISFCCLAFRLTFDCVNHFVIS